MSTQKILTINPDAFKFPGKKKTFKERKIKPVQNANQALKSNKLKKELLKKVKDYQKNKEVEKINETKQLENRAPNLFTSDTLENSDFEREFNKSLTFLHDLSKKNKEKKKKRTLKVSNLDVHIDIPKDNLIYTSNKEPDYGCLKNGTKPTFRGLVKTRKNNAQGTTDRIRIVLDKNEYFDHAAFHNKYTNEENTINLDKNYQDESSTQPQSVKLQTTVTSDKVVCANAQNLSNNDSNGLKIGDLFENKIQILNTMDNLLDTKKKEPEPVSTTKKYVNYELNVPTNPNQAKPSEAKPGEDKPGEAKPGEAKPGEAKPDELQVITDNGELDITNNEEFKYNENSAIPKLCITTKTYKYKLGKNKEKRQIGVLIKNRDTQKRIKKEIEQMKQEDIQTIKNYLREKGLIKLGSQAPNTILRKMYEDSILSGEINNANSNNLIFNYLNT